jgi:hypothetical protein
VNVHVVTSRSENVWINRAVHGLKFGLGVTLASSLFSRFQPKQGPFVASLALSSLAFPLPAYTFDAIALLKKDHDPAPYDAFLTRIWGVPEGSRCRLTLPFVTGFQFILLIQALRLWQAPLPLKLAAGPVAAFPQLELLWKELSAVPSDQLKFRSV